MKVKKWPKMMMMMMMKIYYDKMPSMWPCSTSCSFCFVYQKKKIDINGFLPSNEWKRKDYVFFSLTPEMIKSKLWLICFFLLNSTWLFFSFLLVIGGLVNHEWRWWWWRDIIEPVPLNFVNNNYISNDD